MFGKHLLALLALIGLMAAAPCQAAPGVDRETLLNALQNWPALQGKLDAKKLAEAAQNCPGLNGQIPGSKCPALNGGPVDPIALAKAASKCPALAGPAGTKCPALMGLPCASGNFPPQNPAVQGQPPMPQNPAVAAQPGGNKNPAAAQADKAMKRVVKALEQNKKSADILIEAAKKAGANPNIVNDLQQMSAAFRQVFMTTVSPQQIIENMFAGPQENGSALIITGPDGSRWLLTPQASPVTPSQALGNKPGGFVVPRGPQPGQMAPVPPQAPGMIPPPPPAPGQAPGMIPPPPPASGQMMPAPQQPNAQPGVVGEMIIMEEAPAQFPLWPTKEELGKDGIINYLQKRAQMQQK